MCPPAFTNVSREMLYSVLKKYVDLSFPVHTAFITGCQLGKLNYQNNRMEQSSLIYKCHTPVTTRLVYNFPISNDSRAFERQGIKCWCNLLGIAPNVSLFIHISELSVENNGLWILNVSNPFGSDSVNISIRIATENDKNSFPEGPVLYTVVGIIIIVAVVASLAVFGKRKFSGKAYDQSRTNISQTASFYRGLGVQDDLQVQNGNEYEEIVCEPRESFSGNVQNDKRISKTFTTDYLHPVIEHLNVKSRSESLQTIDSNSKSITSHSSKSDESDYLKPFHICDVDSSKYSSLNKSEIKH